MKLARAHHGKPASAPRDGFAVLLVLLVLMALLVLCTPFLLTVRNTDRSSARTVDRASARIALDTAIRHGKGQLGASHPAVDDTPWSDSEDELAVDNRFDPAFLDANDPEGVMWDVEVGDVSGTIDLQSASPLVLANLVGGVTRLAAPLERGAKEVTVASTAGFDPEGFLWIGSELIGYGALEGNAFTGLVRGLGAATDAEGNASSCGPQPPYDHELGELVVDQRAFGLPEWRTAGVTDVRVLGDLSELQQAAKHMLVGRLPADAIATFERAATLFGAVRAGATWQRATRVTNEINGGTDGCVLVVDDARFFNPGATVQITDGETTELAIVRAAGPGAIVLMRSLVNDYRAYTAEVCALARRPVNVNTATPEVLKALIQNLALQGDSNGISSTEANALVALIVESRPFAGFEDFMRRIVLPAAGLEPLPDDAPVKPQALAAAGGSELATTAIITQSDAVALYKNALNANDNELAFSTMPFAFTSRDVYSFTSRASVNALSGVERVAAVREEVDLVVPQRELLHVWARQEDFDMATRLDLEAPGWATGPEPTTRFDPLYRSAAPTRARANLGPFDTAPSVDPSTDRRVYTFASREDDGYAQLWAAREHETDGLDSERDGHVLHFDDESRDPEGRYLPDGTIRMAPDDQRVGWSEGGLMAPLSFSLWIKPRTIQDGTYLLDVGGPFSDSDRVSLKVERSELVLEVLDGAGDNPNSVFEERARLRYPIATGGVDPGLPPETWSHVSVDVRGNKPSQMSMLVDGRATARVDGLTRLTGSLSDMSSTIAVESTDGFPDRCVLRIGDELIEAERVGSGAFNAVYHDEGELAGFGGRFARELFLGEDGAEFSPFRPGEINQGTVATVPIKGDYGPGTPVELYGYSLALSSDLPPAASELASDLGPFRVGMVTAIERNGSLKTGAQMDPITFTVVFAGSPITFQLGTGLDAGTTDLTGLVLRPADPGLTNVAEVMAGFSRTGGYAALLAIDTENFTISGSGEEISRDAHGHRLGGIEVIHYTGWQGDRLAVDRRGGQVGLRLLNGAPPNVVGNGTFILNWTVPFSDGYDPNDDLISQVMVIPISLPIGASGSGVGGFPTPPPGRSELAQITRTGGESHLTEWVRYDEVANGQLVRSDPNALLIARAASHAGVDSDDPEFDAPVPPPGGGGGGRGRGRGGGGGGRTGTGALGPAGGLDPLAPFGPYGGGGVLGLVAPPAPPPPGPPPPGPPPAVRPPVVRPPALAPRAPRVATPGRQQSGGEPVWRYQWGTPDDTELPVTHATRTQFQFRGVMGTYPQEQPRGAPVLPVFRVDSVTTSAGRPGRFDAVMLMDADTLAPGFPAEVHRSHRPSQYTVASYDVDRSMPLGATASGTATALQQDAGTSVTYLALLEPAQVPVAAGSPGGLPPEELFGENRRVGRITLFPSGERPREVDTVVIGGGSRGGQVPSALVDEIVFGTTRFGEVRGGGPGTLGGALVLGEPLSDGGSDLRTIPSVLRNPAGDVLYVAEFLPDMPEDAGLLRIGEEILCYDGLDVGSSSFHVGSDARGLLGTEPQNHAAFEPVVWLNQARVSVLASGIGADDGVLPLVDIEGFPNEGLVLIDRELIGYTRSYGGVLDMPRTSSEPGAKDRRGRGLFRGRFGTEPAAHAARTPVILFPYRYPDGWTDYADAPELRYLGLSIEQPGAFWKGLYWQAEEAAEGGPRLGVLLRSDPSLPWDANPAFRAGIRVLWEGDREGEPVPLGLQSDRLDLRVFVQHRRGAFDPDTGLSHDWKRTPRFRLLAVEYLGPGMTLRRIDR